MLKKLKSFLIFCRTAFLIRPYYAIRSSWPVWYYFLNRKRRKAYQLYTPALHAEERRIVDNLKRHGIAITHIDVLFPGENTLPEIIRYADAKMATDRALKKKSGFEFDKSSFVTDRDSVFGRLSLRKNIVEVVNAYMGLFSKLFYFELRVTLPVSAGAKPVQSQRWHRDPEDKKMCKVFIYLTDVDEGSGPFTYVLQSHYGGKWRGIFPQRPPQGMYPAEGAIEAIVPPEDIKVCTGRAGTVIFCDTSGLHKGGYAVSRERIMLIIGYGSNALYDYTASYLPEDFTPIGEVLTAGGRWALKR